MENENIETLADWMGTTPKKLREDWAINKTKPDKKRRDGFAKAALTGLCSSRDEAGEIINHGYEWLASEVVKITDAVISALDK